MTDPVIRTASLSPDGLYRYSLGRSWRHLPNGSVDGLALFIMLNPSTADAERDDATIRRCVGFARRWDCGGIRVVNLYAYRATDPAALATVADPVGPLNDTWIRASVECCRVAVAAWGAHKFGSRSARAGKVVELLAGRDLRCLGTTAAGHPRHPLRLHGNTPLIPFTLRRS